MQRVTSIDSLAPYPADLRRWLCCFTSDSGNLSARIAPAAWTRFKCCLNIYVLITSVQSWLRGTNVFYRFQSREVKVLSFIWLFLVDFWRLASTKSNGKKKKRSNLEILLYDSVLFIYLFSWISSGVWWKTTGNGFEGVEELGWQRKEKVRQVNFVVTLNR